MTRSPENELTEKLKSALRLVPIGSSYSHYKNSDFKYMVTAVGLNEATEEINIVYQAQYGQKLTWIRTLESFIGEVEFEGGKVKRFQRI